MFLKSRSEKEQEQALLISQLREELQNAARVYARSVEFGSELLDKNSELLRKFELADADRKALARMLRDERSFSEELIRAILNKVNEESPW